VISIYKNKGSTLDPKNYRPITLLSCTGKIFTSILNDRLNVYFEQFTILDEEKNSLIIKLSVDDLLFFEFLTAFLISSADILPFNISLLLIKFNNNL
jgi:hypothetical protein